MYDQYQEGHSTSDIDKLSAKLALAIPEKESAETPATTAGESKADTAETADQSDIMTAEHSVSHTLDRNTDLA